MYDERVCVYKFIHKIPNSTVKFSLLLLCLHIQIAYIDLFGGRWRRMAMQCNQCVFHIHSSSKTYYIFYRIYFDKKISRRDNKIENSLWFRQYRIFFFLVSVSFFFQMDYNFHERHLCAFFHRIFCISSFFAITFRMKREKKNKNSVHKNAKHYYIHIILFYYKLCYIIIRLFVDYLRFLFNFTLTREWIYTIDCNNVCVLHTFLCASWNQVKFIYLYWITTMIGEKKEKNQKKNKLHRWNIEIESAI